jgi:hypothetical protein
MNQGRHVVNPSSGGITISVEAQPEQTDLFVKLHPVLQA